MKWRRLSLQLPANRLRLRFVRATVRVCEYCTGELAVFCRPDRLAEYDVSGVIIHQERQAA